MPHDRETWLAILAAALMCGVVFWAAARSMRNPLHPTHIERLVDREK